MPKYRHYRPVFEPKTLSGLSEEDARERWLEYVFQCHEAVLDELSEARMVNEGPCPDPDGCCEDCDG